MAIATLSIDLEMRLAKLEQGLDKAARSTDRAAKQIEDRLGSAGEAVRNFGALLAGAVSVGALGAFAKSTIDSIDALNDLADATGSTIENLSALEDVAVRTGTSVDTAGTALVKLNQVLNAAEPDSPAARALQSIGLSVEELKKADPVDALEAVAKALGGYADGADKARFIQEVFGKSARELAPLLKDLAESGKGVATVTSEQAAEAERFNKALFQLQKDAQDTARSFLVDLIPALSRFLEELRAGRQAFGSFGSALLALGTEAPGSAVSGLVRYREELARIADQEAKLKSGQTQGFRLFGIGQETATQGELDALRKRREEAEKYIRYYEQILKLDGRAGGGRGSIVPGMEPPSVPPISGAGGRQPRTPQERQRNPGRVDIIDLGSFEDIQAVDVANARERIAARTRELAEAERERADALKRINDLTGISGARREAEDLALLDEAFFSGAISAEQFEVGLRRLYKGLDELPDASKPAADAMSEFALQAQRNIQDALGDTLMEGLKGNFDDIAKMWGNLLMRLAAQAAATRLAEALFGNAKTGTSGALTDVLGGLFKGIAGTRAGGGPVGAGKTYLVGEQGPELFTAGQSGYITPNGAPMGGMSVLIPQTINVAAGASRQDVVIAADQARRAAVAEVFNLMQRGRN